MLVSISGTAAPIVEGGRFVYPSFNVVCGGCMLFEYDYSLA